VGVVEEIISRSPSPDTYSLPVTDKEFYFCLDYSLLDLLLYAHEHKVPVASVATSLQLSETADSAGVQGLPCEGDEWRGTPKRRIDQASAGSVRHCCAGSSKRKRIS
jgi:NH3-dependent NAD+ synthetase